MPAGCHGNNGQDPETTIQLLQTYVLTVLIYGMEVVLPKGKQLDALEKFYKKYLKLQLSVPVTAAEYYESGMFRPQTISPPSRFAPKTFPS